MLQRALALAERFRTSDNPYFLDTLGWLNYRKGDLAAAQIYLQRAISLAGDERQFRYHLGMALNASGQKARALEELERASADGPDFPGLATARETRDALHVALGQPVPAAASSN